MVGTERDDHAPLSGLRDQQAQELALLRGVAAQREELLELVDQQRRAVGLPGERGEGLQGAGPRHHHEHGRPPGAEPGGDSGPEQRRLARPRRTDEGEQRRTPQHVQAGVDVGLPPEVAVGVLDVERLQPLVGAGRAGGDQRALGQQGGVLLEDRELHGRRVRAGLDTEPGPQHRLELVERAEGLPLVAGLVLGVGLEHPAALAQRCRAHHRLDLGQHLAVPADTQEGLHPQLLGLQAELAEPAGLVRCRGPLLQLLEGGALPQRECLRGLVGRPVGLAQREELVAPGHQGLEPPGVEVVGGYGEPVAVRQGLDRVAAERLAQPDDAPLQDLGRGDRWAVAPERVRELVGRDRLPGTDRQRGENDTVPRTEVSRAIDGQRSEDGDDHGSESPLGRGRSMH